MLYLLMIVFNSLNENNRYKLHSSFHVFYYLQKTLFKTQLTLGCSMFIIDTEILRIFYLNMLLIN